MPQKPEPAPFIPDHFTPDHFIPDHFTPDHFTPVPTCKHIAGWRVEKQFTFLRHLAAYVSVAAAARAVGMSKASAWRLRARPGADSFCRACMPSCRPKALPSQRSGWLG
jgi:hypothetical protein